MSIRREERKLRTREALLDAALALVEHDHTFSSLSLREVTREAGLSPAAFYRHFEDMGQLGLALVDESFRTLRQLMRAARATPIPTADAVRRSVDAFIDHVLLNRNQFLFVVRELAGGRHKMRAAIAAELRALVSELATDLGRISPLSAWTSDDLQMISSLIINVIHQTTHAVLDLPPGRKDDERVLRVTTEKQLRLILLGARLWRSG